MDRLEAMTILVKAIDEGSLSAASRALRMPLPTLSRKLSDLEARLGARLLIRTTRRLALTEAGATYVEAARRILDAVGEAEREAVGEFGEPRGELVVTAPLMFGRLHVLPLVGEFLAAHPHIRVRLALGDRNLHLVEDHVDLAVRIGALPDSALVATRIGSMRAVHVASPALLAAGEPQTLEGLPGIGVDLPGPLMDFTAEPRLIVSNPEAAAQAAEQGVGVARLLYYQVADALAAGRLRRILRAFEPAPAPVHLVHVARGRMPLKLRRFLDFAGPRLRDLLERLEATATREVSSPP
jgi:DNA-binding transcriptional LysR family regulator